MHAKGREATTRMLFHGTLGTAERFCDSTLGQIGDIAEDDHLALPAGKVSKGAVEVEAVCVRARDRVLRDQPLSLAAAGEVERKVGDDARDPAFRLDVLGDFRPALIRASEGLLGELLCL